MSVPSDIGGGQRRVRCVGALIFDERGRLLVVQRGHEPAAGLWSVPGGKVEPGETDGQAVIREIQEETGLTVTVGPLAGVVERAGRGGFIYDIYDYDAAVVGSASVARAGDDAADLRWVSLAEIDALPLTEGLMTALRVWGRLPR